MSTAGQVAASRPGAGQVATVLTGHATSTMQPHPTLHANHTSRQMCCQYLSGFGHGQHVASILFKSSYMKQPWGFLALCWPCTRSTVSTCQHHQHFLFLHLHSHLPHTVPAPLPACLISQLPCQYLHHESSGQRVPGEARVGPSLRVVFCLYGVMSPCTWHGRIIHWQQAGSMQSSLQCHGGCNVCHLLSMSRCCMAAGIEKMHGNGCHPGHMLHATAARGALQNPRPPPHRC
ncbi:hypothetical protein V8C86DRAFT_2484453 [Haematococcus lacustris]